MPTITSINLVLNWVAKKSLIAVEQCADVTGIETRSEFSDQSNISQIRPASELLSILASLELFLTNQRMPSIISINFFDLDHFYISLPEIFIKEEFVYFYDIEKFIYSSLFLIFYFFINKTSLTLNFFKCFQCLNFVLFFNIIFDLLKILLIAKS